MYNFERINNEEIIKIFDKIFIKQGENEKDTTIILTNKRILFLEYLIENEGSEILRITKGVNYIKHKEVYYQINLNEIENITNGKYYQVVLKNDMSFEFDDEELYNLLKI